MVTADDVTSIRQLIAENPGASRRRLSEKLCEVWQWKQANGALRAMVCRGLLLMLHRAGEIELPPIRFKTLNPFVLRVTPAPMLIDKTPIAVSLKELRPIELQQVRRTGDEPLFNSLMEQHHYLQYEQPVGEHLKYLTRLRLRPTRYIHFWRPLYLSQSPPRSPRQKRFLVSYSVYMTADSHR